VKPKPFYVNTNVDKKVAGEQFIYFPLLPLPSLKLAIYIVANRIKVVYVPKLLLEYNERRDNYES
jgi:hypothetical protein